MAFLFLLAVCVIHACNIYFLAAIQTYVLSCNWRGSLIGFSPQLIDSSVISISSALTGCRSPERIGLAGAFPYIGISSLREYVWAPCLYQAQEGEQRSSPELSNNSAACSPPFGAIGSRTASATENRAPGCGLPQSVPRHALRQPINTREDPPET